MVGKSLFLKITFLSMWALNACLEELSNSLLSNHHSVLRLYKESKIKILHLYVVIRPV